MKWRFRMGEEHVYIYIYIYIYSPRERRGIHVNVKAFKS